MEKKEYVKPERNVLTWWMFLEKHGIWLYDYLKEDTKLKVYLDKYNQICKDLENTSEEEVEKLKIEKEKLWNQILIMILSQISQGNKSTSESGSSEIKNVKNNSGSPEVKSLSENFSNLKQLEDNEKAAIKNLDENDLENFICKIRDEDKWSEEICNFCYQECEIRWMWRFILDNYSMWYFSSLITKKELYDKISNIKILDWITNSDYIELKTTELILDYLPLFVWEIDLKNLINKLEPVAINSIWRTYDLIRVWFKNVILKLCESWVSWVEQEKLILELFNNYFILDETWIVSKEYLNLERRKFDYDGTFWYSLDGQTLFIWSKIEGLNQYKWFYIKREQNLSLDEERLHYSIRNADINMSDDKNVNMWEKTGSIYYDKRSWLWIFQK